METSGVWCGVGVIVMILVWYALRIMDWVWFKPKKIEKLLRKQGLKGSSYRFLFGDSKEIVQMAKVAKSKPINLEADIVPRILPFEHKSINIYGKNWFTWLGPRPVLHITEPALVREILANNYRFQRQRGGNPSVRLARGLIDTEGDRWSKHRKIINPAFHVEKLKHMVSAFYTSSEEMINKWEVLTKESSSEVDVWPYLQTLSAHVISRTAFGSSFEEGKKIFELQKELIGLILKVVQSIYIPGSRFLPTKTNKRIKEIDRQVKATIRSIIDKRIIAMKEGESPGDDLLGILLNSNYEAIKNHGNDNNFGLSIDEVIEECKLFYFAGKENTGNLLVWTMILLAQHTRWQTRAREEVIQVFGEKIPDFDGLNRLKIVNMIFNEVLRLYPLAVKFGRMVHQETKLGDMTLPAGTLLQLHVMLLHHDRDIWGDDVKEFKPERFSEGVSKVTKGQVSYLPFGWGPRICIGQNFALLEAKMALVMILQRFCFDLSPSYSHAPHTTLTLQPQFGAPLILHKC